MICAWNVTTTTSANGFYLTCKDLTTGEQGAAVHYVATPVTQFFTGMICLAVIIKSRIREFTILMWLSQKLVLHLAQFIKFLQIKPIIIPGIFFYICYEWCTNWTRIWYSTCWLIYSTVHVCVNSQIMKKWRHQNTEILLYFLMINDWYYLFWSITNTQNFVEFHVTVSILYNFN